MTVRNEEKNLKDVFRIILKHYRIFLIGFVLFATGTFVTTWFIPAKYTATAMFERRTDSSTENISTGSESFQTLKLTLQQELTGDRAFEHALVELGIVDKLPKNSDGKLTPDAQSKLLGLLETIRKNLKFDWKVNTPAMDLVALSLTSSEPNLAMEIPNALVKQYINWASSQITSRLKSSKEFLEKRVADSSTKLNTLVKTKMEFESKYGDLIVDKPENFQTRVQEIYSDIETLHRQQSLAKEKISQVKSTVKTARIAKYQEQLNELKAELESCVMVNQMTQDHPSVQSLCARIVDLKKKIKQIAESDQDDSLIEKEALKNGLALQLATAKAELDGINSEIDRLKERIKTYQEVMTKSIPLREEYERLKKPYQAQLDELNRWQKSLTETQMSLAAESDKRRTQLNQCQLAKKPSIPISPSLLLILAISFGGGFVFGYVLALLADMTDARVHNPIEARSLFGLPIVGIVSEIVPAKGKMLRDLKHAAASMLITFFLAGIMGFSTLGIVLKLEFPDDYQKISSSVSSNGITGIKSLWSVGNKF
jgi:uncharacterized protein involved in exopolysaccharide biosynthesis